MLMMGFCLEDIARDGLKNKFKYNMGNTKRRGKYMIRKLTPDLADDYFDFFENRAFSDGSPFYPCYCNAFNMSKSRIREEFYIKAKSFGGGKDGWKKALRSSAECMVKTGEIQGYMVYDQRQVVGWCNANDRLNYYRVGEFELSDVPDDVVCDYCHKKGEIKSIVCFEIAPDYRGKGLATLLLNEICADAKRDGYLCVEAYPAADGGEEGMAFTGPLSMYEKNGFHLYEQRGNTLIVRKLL